MFDPPNRRVRWFSSLTLRRSLWASMLVLHVPALIASWRMFIQNGLDVGLLGGCLALSAATLFFVLKLWGVPCLQFATDRRSLMVITVAVTLLHADAIGTRLNCVAVPENVPLTATALLAAGFTRVQSVTKAALAHGRGIPKRRILTLLPSHSTWLGAFSPHHRILAALVCPPRAPPAQDTIPRVLDADRYIRSAPSDYRIIYFDFGNALAAANYLTRMIHPGGHSQSPVRDQE